MRKRGRVAADKAPGSGRQADRCRSWEGACDRSRDLHGMWSAGHVGMADSLLEFLEGKRCERGRGGNRSGVDTVSVDGVSRYGFLGFTTTAFPSLVFDDKTGPLATGRRDCLCSAAASSGLVCSGRGARRGCDCPETLVASAGNPLLGLVISTADLAQRRKKSPQNGGRECAAKVSVMMPDLSCMVHRFSDSLFMLDQDSFRESASLCTCSCAGVADTFTSSAPGYQNGFRNWRSCLSFQHPQRFGVPGPCQCTRLGPGSREKVMSRVGAGSEGKAFAGSAFIQSASREICNWTANVLGKKQSCAAKEKRRFREQQESPMSDRNHQFLNLSCLGFISSGFHPLGKYTARRFSPSTVLGFARLQGEPGVSPAVPAAVPDQEDVEVQPADSDSIVVSPTLNSLSPPIRRGLDIEKLRHSVTGVLFSELMGFVPQLGKSRQSFPDKKKLSSVQDFFRYTQTEGRKLFDELDRDRDGLVSLDDLEAAMARRRLPKRYARDFLQRTRRRWFAKSFGWGEFLSLMEQKESTMLRAFTSLSLSKSGTLQKHQVLASLQSAGLPATEGNAAAMMRYLDADTDGSIAYGQFRNFMLLLPPERLEDDPRMVWFEAATVVPLAPPLEIHAGSVLKSALAGGLACALSTSLLHPVDTMKTRVQASTLSFSEVISALPQIGVKGLYRGSVPAIIGQFSSHGLRTGIFEASKMVLRNVAPQVPDLQAQSLASFCSTILGTAVRIPCEVLKQRLQAGLYTNVGEAIVGTLNRDGWSGFFRGTGATLCREVPFYVAGMGIYEEAKKGLHGVLHRELAPWETIAVGGLSGGLAAVCTTPFDVMKTRMMTAAPGMPVTMSSIAITIVQEEGLLALFKGAVPRFFWIAPLGAMNFAGYELAKRAMEKKEKDTPETTGDTKILDVTQA